MAYNSFFPYGYQPYAYPQNSQYTPGNGPFQPEYGQPGVNPQRAQNNGGTGLRWVQGDAGARAYPVGPGNTVDLWDSEAQVIYLKTVDASGMPSMQVLDYTIREGEKQAGPLTRKIDTSKFVTKDELEKRLAEITGGNGHEQPAVSANE